MIMCCGGGSSGRGKTSGDSTCTKFVQMDGLQEVITVTIYYPQRSQCPPEQPNSGQE